MDAALDSCARVRQRGQLPDVGPTEGVAASSIYRLEEYQYQEATYCGQKESRCFVTASVPRSFRVKTEQTDCSGSQVQRKISSSICHRSIARSLQFDLEVSSLVLADQPETLFLNKNQVFLSITVK